MKIMIIFERFVVLISEPVLLFSTISALSSAKVDFVALCTAHTFFLPGKLVKKSKIGTSLLMQ